MNDLDLLRRRFNVDFTFDDAGLLTQTNEPLASARRPAPDLVIGWAGGASIVLRSARIPRDIEFAPGRVPADMTEVEKKLNSIGSWTRGGGPIYRFPEMLESAEAFELHQEHRPMLRRHFPWLDDEFGEWGPAFGMARDGAIVSVCFCARLDDVSAEAGLETAAAYRGRGLAGCVTSAWAASIRGSGRTPFYSTSAENLASQQVARKLNLVQFGVDVTYSFQEKN